MKVLSNFMLRLPFTGADETKIKDKIKVFFLDFYKYAPLWFLRPGIP